jgi:hypothetical protein
MGYPSTAYKPHLDLNFVFGLLAYKEQQPDSSCGMLVFFKKVF